jgi:hypothetical protein
MPDISHTIHPAPLQDSRPGQCTLECISRDCDSGRSGTKAHEDMLAPVRRVRKRLPWKRGVVFVAVLWVLSWTSSHTWLLSGALRAPHTTIGIARTYPETSSYFVRSDTHSRAANGFNDVLLAASERNLQAEPPPAPLSAAASVGGVGGGGGGGGGEGATTRPSSLFQRRAIPHLRSAAPLGRAGIRLRTLPPTVPTAPTTPSPTVITMPYQ